MHYLVTIFLGFGSNIGNREKNIERAIEILKEGHRIKNIKVAPLYLTSPVGSKNQPDFINTVIEGETELKPLSLLKFIKRIEKKMSRKNTGHWGPRIIDIDILFYGNLILKEKRLNIPHPEIVNRGFVLFPLCDIAGDFVHPVIGEKISDMKKNLNLEEKGQSLVKLGG